MRDSLLLIQLILEICYEITPVEVVLMVFRYEKWLQGEVVREERFLGG